MYSFINLQNPLHTASGIAERVLIAPVDWFVSGGIKSPGVWVDYGDEVTIKNNHVFKNGKGFVTIFLAPEKNSYDAKTIGDTGFQKFANEVKMMVAGSYADLHEEIFNLVGKPVIVLVKDSDCPADMWYQVGTECVAARISADFSTGSTKDGLKGYQLTISNTAEKVYLYEGDITYLGEVDPLIARITGNKVGSAVTLDASASTVYGTTIYEYIVLYNDIDGLPSSITLAATGDSASFDTSELTDWNNEGFAIQLIITNEYTTDTTRSSDVTDERPLIMGGFDEGFDAGFDFNIA